MSTFYRDNCAMCICLLTLARFYRNIHLSDFIININATCYMRYSDNRWVGLNGLFFFPNEVFLPAANWKTKNRSKKYYINNEHGLATKYYDFAALITCITIKLFDFFSCFIFAFASLSHIILIMMNHMFLIKQIFFGATAIAYKRYIFPIGYGFEMQIQKIRWNYPFLNYYYQMLSWCIQFGTFATTKCVAECYALVTDRIICQLESIERTVSVLFNAIDFIANRCLYSLTFDCCKPKIHVGQGHSAPTEDKMTWHSTAFYGIEAWKHERLHQLQLKLKLNLIISIMNVILKGFWVQINFIKWPTTFIMHCKTILESLFD